jgi:hypothetical protein
MKTWPFAVVGLICLCLAGCRADPGVTLLERQNRLLEDEIYRLRGVIQDYEEGTMPGAAGEAVQAAPTNAEMTEIRQSTVPPGDSLAPRINRSPSRQTIPPPRVELPSEAQPPGVIPDTFKRPAGIRPPAEGVEINPSELPGQWHESTGPNLQGPAEPLNGNLNKSSKIPQAPAFVSTAKDDSTDVGRLVINQALTGGFSTSGKSGDNGVIVVLETRDAKGRRLEAPGDVSVVLLDPTKSGAQARIARWDFAAGETSKLFRGTGVSRGMYIECPWPENPPQNNRLHLFVRYVTRDGRKLQADQPIEIAVPGEKVSRWNSSAPEIQQADASEAEFASSQSDAQGVRSASGTNSAKLNRPTWSPDRF